MLLCLALSHHSSETAIIEVQNPHLSLSLSLSLSLCKEEISSSAAMVAGVSVTACGLASRSLLRAAPPRGGRVLFFSPLPSRRLQLPGGAVEARPVRRRRRDMAVCFVMEPSGEKMEVLEEEEEVSESELGISEVKEGLISAAVARAEERTARKRSEQRTYLIAAVMSSFGITSMAVAAVYYRFYWQMEGAEVPMIEMLGTFALSVGAAVGMEFWARWAHRALWHASLWHMHESHHRPREGPFELNDVFAIINAVPAMALLSFGFFNRGLVPGLCFGAGLGITLFGMAYMFVHDGLVHRRFPVGPIANVPYFRRVAAAHQIHHMDKFDGVPYGLFLGPKELEEVEGMEELEKEIKRRMNKG